MPSEGMYQVWGTFRSASSGSLAATRRTMRLARNRPLVLPPSRPWLLGSTTVCASSSAKSSTSTCGLQLSMKRSWSESTRRMSETLRPTWVEVESSLARTPVWA